MIYSSVSSSDAVMAAKTQKYLCTATAVHFNPFLFCSRTYPIPDYTVPNPDYTVPNPDYTVPNPDYTVPNPDYTVPSLNTVFQSTNHTVLKVLHLLVVWIPCTYKPMNYFRRGAVVLGIHHTKYTVTFVPSQRVCQYACASILTY